MSNTSSTEEEESFSLLDYFKLLESEEKMMQIAALRSTANASVSLMHIRDECSMDVLREMQKKLGKLFVKRAAIISGKVEPTDEEIAVGQEQEKRIQSFKEMQGIPSISLDDGIDQKHITFASDQRSSIEASNQVQRGIPQFWLKALLNSDLAEMIEVEDIPALESLTDITIEIVEETSNGIKATFSFDPNPYFENETLTKRYWYDDMEKAVMDTAIKFESDEIQWKSSKMDLTQVEVRKKQRHRSGRGIRVVTRIEPKSSFFNFFETMDLNEMDSDMNEEDIDLAIDTFAEDCSQLDALVEVVERAIMFYKGDEELIAWQLEGKTEPTTPQQKEQRRTENQQSSPCPQM